MKNNQNPETLSKQKVADAISQIGGTYSLILDMDPDVLRIIKSDYSEALKEVLNNPAEVEKIKEAIAQNIEKANYQKVELLYLLGFEDLAIQYIDEENALSVAFLAVKEGGINIVKHCVEKHFQQIKGCLDAMRTNAAISEHTDIADYLLPFVSAQWREKEITEIVEGTALQGSRIETFITFEKAEGLYDLLLAAIKNDRHQVVGDLQQKYPLLVKDVLSDATKSQAVNDAIRTQAKRDGKKHIMASIAAILGLKDIAVQLLDQEYPENVVNSAAQYGHLEIVKLCFENYKLDAPQQALCAFVAAQFGHLEIVKLCFEKYNLDAKEATSCACVAAQHGHLEVVKFCFAKGVKSDSEQYIAGCAASARQLEVVKYFLQERKKNIDVGAILRLATEEEKQEVVDFINEWQPQQELEADIEKIINASYVDPDVIKLFVANHDSQGVLALILEAIKRKDLDVLSSLQCGHTAVVKDILKDRSKFSAVQKAIESKDKIIQAFVWVILGFKDLLTPLVTQSTDDSNVQEMLGLAITNGHLDIVKWLFENHEAKLSNLSEFLSHAKRHAHIKISGYIQALQQQQEFESAIESVLESEVFSLQKVQQIIDNNDEKLTALLVRAIEKGEFVFITRLQCDYSVPTLLQNKEKLKKIETAITKLATTKQDDAALIAANFGLAELVDKYARPFKALSIMMVVAENGHLELLKSLSESYVDKLDEPSVTSCAARNGQLEVLKWCVEDFEKPNVQNATVVAASYDKVDVLKWCFQNHRDKLSLGEIKAACQNGSDAQAYVTKWENLRNLKIARVAVPTLGGVATGIASIFLTTNFVIAMAGTVAVVSIGCGVAAHLLHNELNPKSVERGTDRA